MSSTAAIQDRALAILREYEQAQAELQGKVVILTNCIAGTVDRVHLDKLHCCGLFVLRFLIRVRLQKQRRHPVILHRELFLVHVVQIILLVRYLHLFISRDEARHRPKIDGWVRLPNIGDHVGAVLLPIGAEIGQKILRQLISRAGRPARPRFSARYKTTLLISAHK